MLCYKHKVSNQSEFNDTLQSPTIPRSHDTESEQESL